jgi:hypothetical protein
MDRRPRSSGGTAVVLLPPCKAVEKTLRALSSLLVAAMSGPECSKARLSLPSTGMLVEPQSAMLSFLRDRYGEQWDGGTVVRNGEQKGGQDN